MWVRSRSRRRPRSGARSLASRAARAGAGGAAWARASRRPRIDGTTRARFLAKPPRPRHACRKARPTSRGAGLLRLDARELHHLAPFLGFVDDELAELTGTHRQRLAAELGDAHLHLGI